MKKVVEAGKFIGGWDLKRCNRREKDHARRKKGIENGNS